MPRSRARRRGGSWAVMVAPSGAAARARRIGRVRGIGQEARRPPEARVGEKSAPRLTSGSITRVPLPIEGVQPDDAEREPWKGDLEHENEVFHLSLTPPACGCARSGSPTRPTPTR